MILYRTCELGTVRQQQTNAKNGGIKMRLTKAVKEDICELLQEGLDVFLARWERTDNPEDEMKYDHMCEIVLFLSKRLNLGDE